MRNTKQRDCIFDIVNSSYNHLNAYQVYDIAKEVIPNISLGTVYRNLLWLSENDKIRTIIVDDVIRYDRNVIHDHLLCTKCGNIIAPRDRYNLNISVYDTSTCQKQRKLCSLCHECYIDLLDYLAVSDINWDE